MTRSSILLGPEGPLAAAFSGYEHREGQLAMADAVELALEEGRTLLCEAGTGTGKTLAYLVPAILSGKKVVISTATKALEEQIFHKDLPIVEKHLGLKPEAALVKGLGNYLCRRRFAELRTSPAAVSDPNVVRLLPMLEAWVEDTEVGDVAELSGLGDGDPVWREIASSSETRIGATCEHFDHCFVTRMRREMDRAQLLVVNHHLFFADLALKTSMRGAGAPRGGALPNYDAVIFDEAHQLEDIATSFFGRRVSRARVDTMLRDAERGFIAAGLACRVLGKGEGTALVALVRQASEELFAELARLVPLSGRRSETAPEELGGEGRTSLPRDAWSGSLVMALEHVDELLTALSGYAETHAVSDAVRLVASRADALREDLDRISDPATNHVTWLEARARSVSIGSSPVDLGATFRREVFERIGSVVLTSATLTTGGPNDFRFLRSRMGLDASTDVPVDELSVASPFDHAAASLLYTPKDLPEASDPAFIDRAAERIAELVQLTRGGAFVLCTSHRAMKGLARALRGRTPDLLLCQGDAPKSSLLARFRVSGNAVLVATMSFWEGVDVPGDALRLVILEKIPFAVPTDPVVVARCNALELEGKNPFISYSVPQAAITLKQGFGRLLRTRADRGIVAILDRRIRMRGYGRTLLASLPAARHTDDFDGVLAFWDEIASGRVES
jgi:ATP-dependent DNA helicase DinG